MDFCLTHFTDIYHLPEIVSRRVILSPVKQREFLKDKWIPGKCYDTAKGLGDIERYDKSIFLGMLFPNKDHFFNPRYIHFIFSSEILIDNPGILSKDWKYGKLEDGNYIIYDTNKDLDYNLQKWLNFAQLSSRFEILLEDQIILNSSNLVKIYVPEEFRKSSKIQNLISENPDLPWIFQV